MSFWDNFANSLTAFVEDTKDALTVFVEDTKDVLTDFLESANTLTYGNYGGENYSAGVVGGTITETSPPPVDAYDAAFYLHDLAHQSSSDPAVRLPADIQVVESLIDLTEQGGGSVNVLTGGDGDDIQMGGDGVDWIYGGLGNDRQNGGAGTDGVFGGAGNDILVLGAGHDAGWGGADDDNISGGTGSDFLFGGAGDDLLDGGSERDYLSGGTGADTFMFVDAFGQDFVNDFRQGEDTLEFQVAGVSGFDDLDIVLNGSDTVISTTASATDTVTLVGFTGTLTDSDFLLS